MVMKPEPLAGAIRAATRKVPAAGTVLLTPQGRPFDQNMAKELASFDGLVMICGRYEGVDERICHDLIDYEISIGDYVLTGGELAAMIIVDAVTRLIPGALGGEDAAENDSFSNGLLEHAHYTRPRIFEDREVPDVLLSGHHQEIERWRLESSLMRTLLKRSDLLQQKNLNRQEIEILEKWRREINNILELQNK
jgi:tRNA (guanine37-N1)-methyltransferase